MLIEFASNMRTDEEFARVVAAASKTCKKLGIPLSNSGTRRKKSRPAALQDSVMDRCLAMSSEAVASGSAEERLRNEMRVDFFLPVLDAFLMSPTSRFNSECTTVLKLISSVVQYGDNFNEFVRQLALLVQLNADLCVAEGNVLMKNKDYRPSEDETASDPPPTLQSITSKMVTSGHSAVYRNFYALAVFCYITCHVSFLRARAQQ